MGAGEGKCWGWRGGMRGVDGAVAAEALLLSFLQSASAVPAPEEGTRLG